MLNLFVEKNDIIYDGGELAVLLILNGMQSEKRNPVCTSINEIGYFLTGKFLDSQNDKKMIKVIKEGLSSLINAGDIKCIEKVKNDYIIDGESCIVDIRTSKFVVIELEEMQRIMSLGVKGFSVLNYFVNLISTMNNNTKFYNKSQDSMCEDWNMNKVTINEYNKILKDLKLIYAHRPHSYFNNGKWINYNNIYCRYKDKDEVAEKINCKNSLNCNGFLTGTEKVNIKMRYTNFCKGAKKYKNNQKMIDELIEDSKKYNNSIFSEETQKLDLSIFD